MESCSYGTFMNYMTKWKDVLNEFGVRELVLLWVQNFHIKMKM
jgi:hypothetical protein